MEVFGKGAQGNSAKTKHEPSNRCTWINPRVILDWHGSKSVLCCFQNGDRISHDYELWTKKVQNGGSKILLNGSGTGTRKTCTSKIPIILAVTVKTP